ncbi:beta-lactamase family protein [Pendulispora rubella]|uniref:Beta-lactamase family protein n=1 Tax=Pendulispora rubella TaxID=2741070 RepID=A0ABZ2KVK5_9BACT
MASRWLVVLMTWLACAGCARPAKTPDPAPTVDGLMADYAKPDGPGASVVVIHDGRIAFSRAYGLAEVQTHTAATVETNYRLASLTKQFTAMAVMLLVADGKLRYDDRVVDVLPGFPDDARQVRIRHLLNHTSGIWDYEDFVPENSTVQVKDADVVRLVAQAGRMRFEPGTQVRYSNSGYAVLARVVEQVSGKSFAVFLRERIFEPAGMRGTVAYEAGISTVPRRAYGYAPEAGRLRPRDQSPTSAVLGDGGVYSSVVDLAAWDRALEKHTLLGEAGQREAFASAPLPGGASAHYGFGWFVDQDAGRPRLTHHGETCGFTNAIVRYPAQRLTVIVLTNRAGGEPWRIAQSIANHWLEAPGREPWPFESMANSR